MNRSYSKIRHIQEANMLLEKRILESKSNNLNSLLSEQEVRQGAAGDPYQYKKEGGKYFYAKKAEGTNAKWVEQTKPDGIKAIQTKIFKEQPGTTNQPTNTNQPAANKPAVNQPTNTNQTANNTTNTPTNTNQTANNTTNTPTNPNNTANNTTTNPNQTQAKTEVKEGAPLKNPEENLKVGTEFVTWTRDQNRKETNKLCKVVQVEDIANEQGEYRMVKATDVNDGTNCGDVSFLNPKSGDKEGWIAFSKQSQYNYYQKGYIGNKTDKDPRGNWSWEADSGRSNDYSIYNKA